MQFPGKAAAALGALALLGLSGTHAQAQAFGVGQTVQDGWVVSDDTAGSQISLVPTPSNDGDGSLQLTVTGGSKSQVVHAANVLLSNVNALSFDNFVTTGASNEAPAFRLGLNPGGTRALVWEAAYNGGGVGTQTWQTFDITKQLFWERANGVNYNGGGDAYTLAQWLDPNFNPASGAPNAAGATVYGYSLGLGSGVADYTGNIDHVNFNGHVTDFSTPAPEPSSVAAFAFTGLGAMGLMLHARRRRPAA